MKNFFRIAHLWLALPVGLFISLICLTGAILVFQDEIQEWSHPTRYFVSEVKEKPLSPEQLVAIVNPQLLNNSVASIQRSSDPNRTYAVGLKEGFRASAFVNPYTGEITGYYSPRDSWMFTVMSLHRWLLDGTRTWGKQIVATSTILLVIIVLTGILYQLPLRLNLKTFSIRFKSGGHKMLYDFHNVLGLYSCILLLVAALTGLMWSYDWYRNGVYKLFGAEVPTQRGEQERGHGKGETKPLNTASWDEVLQMLQEQNPDFKSIQIAEGQVIVKLKSAPNQRASDRYQFNPGSGEITKTELYKDSAKASRIFGWSYSLHVGDVWGIWSKILVFLASLIGASLPITGYWMYVKSLLKKRKKRESLILN